MTQYDMTANLSEKCNVTLEEARAALEAGNWNVLTATHLLEQESFRRKQELDQFAPTAAAAAVQAAPEEAEADGAPETVQSAATEKAVGIVPNRTEKRRRGRGLRSLGDRALRLIACGNRNHFVVRRDGRTMLELPVTVLALLGLFAFWVCVPLLVIGLFTGCRYSFSGRELGREGINGALTKAADTADHMKQAVARA